MESGQGTDRVIGVVDPSDGTESDRVVDRLAERVEQSGYTAVVGSPPEVFAADPTSVCAVGQSGMIATAQSGPSVPVLPVAAGRGLRSVPSEEIESAVDALAGGEFETELRDRNEVRIGGRAIGVSLYDVMLVTEDPARISEYSIRTGDRRVSRFRADGVVVATPAGSHEYAAAAGAPILAQGTGVVVVPVAQFATDRDRWVFPGDEGVTLRVERDEGPVELLLDDERHGVVAPNTDVSLARVDPIHIAVVSESLPYWPA